MSHNIRPAWELIEHAARNVGQLVNHTELGEIDSKHASAIASLLTDLQNTKSNLETAIATGDNEVRQAAEDAFATLAEDLNKEAEGLRAQLASLQVTWRDAVKKQVGKSADLAPEDLEVGARFIIKTDGEVEDGDPLYNREGQIAWITDLDDMGVPTWQFEEGGEGTCVYNDKLDQIEIKNDQGVFVPVAKFLGAAVVQKESYDVERAADRKEALDAVDHERGLRVTAVAGERTARQDADTLLGQRITDELASTETRLQALIENFNKELGDAVKQNTDAIGALGNTVDSHRKDAQQHLSDFNSYKNQNDTAVANIESAYKDADTQMQASFEATVEGIEEAQGNFEANLFDEVLPQMSSSLRQYASQEVSSARMELGLLHEHLRKQLYSWKILDTTGDSGHSITFEGTDCFCTNFLINEVEKDETFTLTLPAEGHPMYEFGRFSYSNAEIAKYKEAMANYETNIANGTGDDLSPPPEYTIHEAEEGGMYGEPDGCHDLIGMAITVKATGLGEKAKVRIVDPQGFPVEGKSHLDLDFRMASVMLVYIGSGRGWVIVG